MLKRTSKRQLWKKFCIWLLLEICIGPSTSAAGTASHILPHKTWHIPMTFLICWTFYTWFPFFSENSIPIFRVLVDISQNVFPLFLSHLPSPDLVLIPGPPSEKEGRTKRKFREGSSWKPVSTHKATKCLGAEVTSDPETCRHPNQ